MPNLLNFFRWLENFNFVGWSFVVQVQAENLKSLTMNSKRKIKLCSRSKMVDQGTRSAKSRYEWKRGNQKKKEKILNYIQKPRKLYFIFDPPPFLISPYIETTALRQTRFLIYFKWNYFFFNFHVLVLFNIPQSDISLYAPMTYQSWEDYQQEETLDKPGTVLARVGPETGRYHISDMIPVALPQHRAGASLTRSLFPVPRTQIVQ